MGGKTATSTQAVSIPPQVLAQYQAVNDKANQTAQTPFQQYGGQFVAPVNQQQQTGISGINSAATMADPYYGAATGQLGSTQAGTTSTNQAATGLAASSANAVDPSNLDSAAINKYMSPYLNTVLGSESALLNQNNQQQQAGQLGTAISSGAFGGDRTGLAAANLEQQQNLANANIYSGILNQGYGQALSTAQQQQGVGLAAGQANRQARAAAGQELSGIGATTYGEGANTATTLAGLGAGRQTAGLQGAQAQLGAGTVQQQTQQAQDTALYNQFLQQQSYPFQVDQFLANIAEGTGALSGSTTTTQQPGGFFSDERLKEDMEPIGKTFDGQPIYRYKMKGDKRDQIGLSAQEVEKKHPHAVGLAGGYRWVDYGKATEEAANRGHFYGGGHVSGGGRVWRPAAMAVGGSPSVVDQNDLNAILAAQSGMYAPMSNGAGVYGSTGSIPHGGSGRVPAPSGAVPHLVTAGGLAARPSGAENVKQWTDTAKSATDLYKSFHESHPSNAAPKGPAPADTPGDQPSGLAAGGRAGYDSGGGTDISSILEAQRAMYQPKGQNRDIATGGGGGNHQLAVASGSPAPPPSGASKTQQMVGLGKDAYGAYKHFNKPTTPTSTTPAATTPAADSSAGLGAADTTAAAPAAAEVSAPAAAEGAGTGAATGAAEGAAASGATTAASSAAAGAATDAAAEEAAALAAEYVAADAAVAVAAAANGGSIRGGYADGGTPYRGDSSMYQDQGNVLNIPDQENSAKVQTAGPIKKQPTGLQTLMLMGDPQKSSSLAGGMFSNTALARGGLASARRGYEDGGAPDDTDPSGVIAPEAMGRGVINRSKKGPDLLYTRDAGSQIPYAAPPLKGGNNAPTGADLQPDAPPWSGLESPPATAINVPRGVSGNSWEDGPSKARGLAAPPAGLAAAHAAANGDQGPPKPGQPPVAYNGPVGLNAPPPPDTSEKAPPKVPVDNPSWWDKIKDSKIAKPENLIPLLTAIGAMGSAPTRSLGVAASQGLLAGAGSYLPTRQSLADIQQTGAETQRIGAETRGQDIENLGALQSQYALRNMALYEDPNGPIPAMGPDGKVHRYAAKLKTASMGAQQTPPPAQYNFLGKNGMDAAREAGTHYMIADPAQQADSTKRIDETYQAGNEAQARMPTLHTWEQVVASNPEGLLAPGTMHQLRTDAANMWNTAAAQLGHPEFAINGLEDAQMAEKVSRGSAAMAEASNQQRSFNALKAFLQQTPNPEMQRGAALRLIADAHMENQQAIDKKNYLDEFDQESRRHLGIPATKNFLATEALNNFDKDYRPDTYEGERNKLSNVLQSGGYDKLRTTIQNAPEDKKAKLMKALDEKYGPNFHRYFTGN
jgi:hypothetical protein